MNSRSSIRLSIVLASLLVTVLVGGCYDQSSEVTLHQAGEYQGAIDPLLELSANPAHDKKLQERFLTIQTDR